MKSEKGYFHFIRDLIDVLKNIIGKLKSLHEFLLIQLA